MRELYIENITEMDREEIECVVDLEQRLGLEWFDYQLTCFNEAYEQLSTDKPERLCLYYKTGAGKSYTALACMALWDCPAVLVICPPSTNDQWVEAGRKLGITVTPMSHAKFRMKTTKMSKTMPVIADEFHLFGGHNGMGWKKFDLLAKHSLAPIVLASATPNYNDAERVYCIQHVMDPDSVKGGYLQFLYQNCITQQNPFSATPDVTGFLRFPDAAAYLADLPGVMYLADDLVYDIIDHHIQKKIPQEMTEFGLNPRRKKLIASIIEERHAEIDLTLIADNGQVNVEVRDWLRGMLNGTTPTLLFCNHSTVADAVARTFDSWEWDYSIVTGKTSTAEKQRLIEAFKGGNYPLLIGTASLATGTDGLDKMCDWLLIVDDTDDDSLRRQLIGRIMPRGRNTGKKTS